MFIQHSVAGPGSFAGGCIVIGEQLLLLLNSSAVFCDGIVLRRRIEKFFSSNLKAIGFQNSIN